MLVRMGETLRARRDIYLALLRRQEGPCPEIFVEDPQAGIALAQGLLAAGDAAEELRCNVEEEQQLHNEFLLAVREKLEPLQSATAIVHSYPWCPEALAIVNCAADEEEGVLPPASLPTGQVMLILFKVDAEDAPS
ncbi:hypothetical protein WJX75_002250 [Coccomyxa subellipsoidea]|uniref:Rubisco LSMT substrate-binding domain-containing protein n=1 Tax=Coccomyxa subellipsoidea TaxID=248742 RepID=A0ABR2YZY2_9CHLO